MWKQVCMCAFIKPSHIPKEESALAGQDERLVLLPGQSITGLRHYGLGHTSEFPSNCLKYFGCL